MEEVAAIWDTLDAETQTKALEKMFAKTRANVGAAIISNIDNYKKTMNTLGQEETLKSADEELETARDAISFHLNALKETWTGIAQGVFESTELKTFIDMLTKVSEAIKVVTDNVGLLGVVIGGLGLAKIFKNFNDVKDLFSLAKSDGLTGLSVGLELLTGLSVGTLGAIAGAIAAIGVAAYAYYKYINQYNDSLKNLKDSSSAFKTSSDELENLKTQLQENSDKIDEIQSKGKLSITDQQDLENLKNENAELERQIKLQEIQNNLDKQNLVEDAQKTADLSQTIDLSRGVGNGYNNQTTYFRSSLKDATKNEITQLSEYKKQRLKLLEQINEETNEENIKSLNKQLGDLDSTILEYENEISKNVADMESVAYGLSFGNTKQQKEAQEYYDIIDQYTNIDLSDTQRALVNLDNFFSSQGGDSLKSYLEDAYDSGKDLNDAIGELGLSLDDLGVDSVDQLNDYFADTTSTVDDATNSVENYRKTVADIESAIKAINSDEDWSTINSALKKTNEQLKLGKTGTDEFQTMAQFLSNKNLSKLAKKEIKNGGYAADVYEKAYKKNKKLANRWYGQEDETVAMQNFVDDFKDKGLFKVTTDKNGLETIKANFSTTAEAADKFGISVNAVETMLEALGAYGYDFFSEEGENISKSGEALNEYTIYLEKLKEIRDSMNEGSEKDKLTSLIEGFDSEYESFNDDLSKLSEEQVVHIKFEYDLASIQQEVDKIKDEIEGGNNTIENNAKVIAGNQSYIEKQKQGLGLDKGGVNTPQQISDIENTISSLKEKLKNATEDDKLKIQAEIENQQELEKQLLNEFSDLNPEINPKTNTKNINKALDEVFGKPKTIDAKIKVTSNNIDSVMGEDNVISFKADFNGVEQEVRAVKDVDGTIHYYSTIDGKVEEVELDKEGKITYKTDTTNATEGAKNVEEATEKIEDKKEIKITADTSNAITGINTINNAISNMTSYKKITIETEKKTTTVSGKDGSNGRYGSAHRFGSAFKNGSGNWGVGTNGKVLVGEEEPEILVHGSSWRLVGQNGAEFVNVSKDDIIFNGTQSRQLLENGFASANGGRASSLLHGSAYKDGSTSGMAFRLSSTYESSSKTSSKKSSNSSKKNKSKKNKKSNGFQDWLDKLFDWIEIRVDRLERKVKNYQNKAELYIKKGEQAISSAKRDQYYNSAANNYKDAYNTVGTQISTNKTAQTKYNSQAKSILDKALKSKKISKSEYNKIVSQVANGTMAIGSWSKDKQTVINAYKGYIDKALDCKDAITELQKTQNELFESWANIPIEKAESAIKKLQTGFNGLNAIQARLSAANLGGSAQSQLVSLLGQSYEEAKNTTASKLSAKDDAKDVLDTAKSNKAKAEKKITKADKKRLKTDGTYNLSGLKKSSAQYKRLKAYNDALKAQKSAQSKYNSANTTYKNAKASESLLKSEYDKAMKAYNDGDELSYQKYLTDAQTIEKKNEMSEYKNAYDTTVSNYASSKVAWQNAKSTLASKKSNLKSEDKKRLKSDGSYNLSGLKKSSAQYKRLKAYNDALQKSVTLYNEMIIAQNAEQQAAENLAVSEAEYAEQVVEAEKTKFDTIQSYYDNYRSYQESELKAESENSLKKARGETLTQDDYRKQINDVKKQKQLINEEKEALQNQLNESVANGTIKEGTTEWYQMKIAIANCDKETTDLDETIIDLGNDLTEAKLYEKFGKALEKAEKLKDAISALSTMFSEDMYFDKNGNLTEVGVTAMALKYKDYENAKSNLQTEINKLNEIKKMSVGSGLDYESQEAKDNAILEQTKAVQSAFESETSALQSLFDMSKNVLEEELNALDKVIEKQKDALNKKKEYYDYDRTLSDKNKNIQLLEKQIRALEGVSGAEANAKRASLQAQLTEANKDYEDTIQEHLFSLESDSLDDLSTTLHDEFDEYLDELKNLNSMKEMLAIISAGVKDNVSISNDTLKKYAQFYGINDLSVLGYASGTKRVTRNGVYQVNERGQEVKLSNGILESLGEGDMIFNHQMSENLWKIAKQYPNLDGKMIKTELGSSITNTYGSLLNVQGDVTRDALPELKDILQKSYEYTSRKQAQDLRKIGRRN